MQIQRLPILLALCAPAAAQVPLYDVTDPDAALDQVLAPVGDLDGDGLPEFAVGSPAVDVGTIDGGVVRVFDGGDLTLLFEAYGSQEYAALGASVDGAGDVDADGFPDLIAGCGQFQGNLARVWSGATGAVLHDLSGGAQDTFGWSVAGLGDFDLDGFGDVAVGAIQDFLDADGYVLAFSGATGSPVSAWSSPCSGSGKYGQGLAALGDVTGDGWPDLGIYRLGDLGCASRVTVVSYLGGELVLPAPDTLIGGRDGVARAGDVDGDGLPDIVVGAPGSGTCGGSIPGRVRVSSGATGALLLDVQGEDGCTWLGYSVDGVGDLDGDGRGDVAAGAIGPDRIDVFSGMDASKLLSFASPLGGNFGYTLVALGDLNGDGAVELGSSGPGGGAWVLSTCPGTLAPYGQGCAGSGGFVPQLSAVGCPNPGNTLTLRIREGYGSAPAFLAIGTGAGALPLGGACQLLVSPLITVVSLGTLFDFGPGFGYRDVTITVPAGTAGASFRFQAANLDPGAALGFAVSNGLLVEVF